MNFMALTAIILSFPNKEWYLTAYFLARQVGALLTSLIAGNLADRYDRRKIMVVSDLVSGVAVLLPLINYHPFSVYLSAFILGCTYQSFYISYSASIPDMFGIEKAQAINSLIVRIGSAVSIVGFILGGMVTEWFGIAPVIIFDSLTYFFAAVILFGLRWQSANAHHVIKPIMGKVRRIAIYWPKMRREMTLIVGIAFFYSLAVAGYNFSLPLLAVDFKQQALANGFFWSALSLGMLIGSLIKKMRLNLNHYFAAIVLFSLSIGVSFAFHHIFLIAILLFFAGLFEGFAQITATTLLQRAPSEQRGSVFGVQALFNRSGFLIGFLVCPLIVSALNLQVNVWVLQLLLMISIVIAYIYWNKGVRNGKGSRDFI
jgi:MFS family permease